MDYNLVLENFSHTIQTKPETMKKLYSTLTLLVVFGMMAQAQNRNLPIKHKTDIAAKSAAESALVSSSRISYMNNPLNESTNRGGLACAFDEDFDASFPGTWTNVTNNANENWTWLDAGGNPDGHMDIAYDLSPQNESLITPLIDFTAIPNPTLKFDWFMSYYWGVDPFDNYDLSISVSTDGINWTEVWTETDFGGEFDSYEWYTTNVDMSAFSSLSNAVIRFNYNGADGAQAKFDNISLCSAQNDLRVNAVYTGDIINDYAYSQIPVSQTTQIIAGTIFSNVGGTALTNVMVDSETLSFVSGTVSTGTVAGPTLMVPGQSDTVWVNTNYTPSMIDTIAQFFTATPDQTDATPVDNEGVEVLLITDDTWAHDFELEDYFAFGYESGGTLGSQGFEMGAAYYCQTSGGTIYAVDFPLGSATTAQSITIKIYEDALATGLVSSTLYDILPGDLSTTTVNFINVPLDVPVPMSAGSVYTATIAIEGGDDAYILGNNLDDGDGGHVLYQADNDTWYNWVGLTTAMRLRVSSVVGTEENVGLNSFNVYPNPATDQLNINFVPENDEMVTVDVLSIDGTLVQSETVSALSSQNNRLTVDATSLAAGVYTIRLLGEKTSSVQRVVVQ